MPEYKYRILRPDSRVETQGGNFPDSAALEKWAARSGLRLIDFRKVESGTSFLKRMVFWRKWSHSRQLNENDLHGFFYEMGMILGAGVPILHAVSVLSDDSAGYAVRRFLDRVMSGLKEGTSLSDILLHCGKFHDFSKMVPILRMGEKTGTLDRSCLSVAESLQKSMEIRSEITSALTYPLLVVFTGIAAIYMMLVFVLPRFGDVLENFKVALPWYTRMLLRLSGFLEKYGDLLALSALGCLLVLLFMLRTADFKRKMSALGARLPWVKNVRFNVETISFTGSLATLIGGGVPVLEALRLWENGFSAEKNKKKLKDAIDRLRKGRTLADALSEEAMFPSVVVNMVRVGEESGTLPLVLQELTRLLSHRFMKKVKFFLNVFEPLIIIGVAVFVGLIILSILPIIINISDINF